MQTPDRRPLALITGASSGIGLELARLFAADGYDLVIAADREAELDQARDALLAGGAARVEAIAVDLARHEANEHLWCAATALGPVDVLVANAGHGEWGLFATQTDLERERHLIDTNVMSPVHLAKRAVAAMVERGGGKILFTGSIAGTSPGPYHAVYHASKAFVNSFAQALRNEVKDQGITVTVLMPGATETEFFAHAGMEEAKVAQADKADPKDVAKAGYDALMAGDDHVVPGLMNKVNAVLGEAIPPAAAAAMSRKQNEPAS